MTAPRPGIAWWVMLALAGAIALYPFATALKYHLEIVARYIYWHSLSESGQFGRIADDRRLFQTGVTYYLDPKSHFGIGLDYRRGEDVDTGLRKQENITAALKVKF